MKRGLILAVILAGISVLGFSQTSGAWTVTNTATWITAVNGIRSGGNNQAYAITITGTVSIPPSTESTFGAGTGITVTLEGGGTLSPSGKGSLLRIGYQQTIIAKNLTLRGQEGNSDSLVKVGGRGFFRMEGNASVSGNTISGGIGGGVFVDMNGTFTMQDKSSVSGNTASGGLGGGVYVLYGTFTMQGNASVSGNTVSGGIGGGGVFVQHGTFTMQDKSSVSGNTASGGLGGGVFVQYGTFTKTGGTIYGNDAEPRLRNTASSKKGHAVYSGANWRNSTVDTTTNPDSSGFWLNEED